MNIARRNFVKSAALLAVAGVPTFGSGETCTDDATLLSLGLKKQLFFDNLLVESVQDITRQFHPPQKYEGNPLIVKDKPWERELYFRTASYRVLHDPKDKLFKCWYGEVFQSEQEWVFRDLYANSEDGIHWVKPALGIYRENGQDTNIFWPTGSGLIRDVIIDPFESDESKRFKSLHAQAPPSQSPGHYDYKRTYTEACYSADGVHWKTYEERPSFGKFGAILGDVVLLSYDLDDKVYILNTRHPQMEKAALNLRLPQTKSFFRPHYPDDFARINKRRIFQCLSSDLIHWSEPTLILGPDDEDNLDEYLYGMAQYRVGDTWIGLLNVLHSVPDVVDIQLAYSLDGRCWKRIRQPWLTHGPAGGWDQIMVDLSTEPIEVGDELWFYYGGSGLVHHDWYDEALKEGLDVPEARNVDSHKVGFFMGLAKLRLDGYCSLNAGPVREGIFVTRQLASPGTGIVMNAECGPGGYIDVEVFNQADEVLPGYSRKDFDRFTGNAVRQQLSWQGRTKVPAEPFRRLVFYMRNAKLYSLQFAA